MHYESDREIRREALDEVPSDDSWDTGGSHATTGGAAAAGAVTGGVIGLTGGPVGAAIGAVGGAIVGAAAERMMHSDDGDRAAHDHAHDHVSSESTSFAGRPVEEEPPTEVEEPVGEPLAEIEPAVDNNEPRSEREPRKPRPLI